MMRQAFIFRFNPLNNFTLSSMLNENRIWVVTRRRIRRRLRLAAGIPLSIAGKPQRQHHSDRSR